MVFRNSNRLFKTTVNHKLNILGLVCGIWEKNIYSENYKTFQKIFKSSHTSLFNEHISNKNWIIPLTIKLADREVDPAVLEAMQVYSPACLSLTESIVNCFVLLPVSVTTIP